MKSNELPEKLYVDLFKGEFSVSRSPINNSVGVEYTRTDFFIEKARKWFEMQNEGVDSDGNYKCDMTDWECFKSYMKGGKV